METNEVSTQNHAKADICQWGKKYLNLKISNNVQFNKNGMA